MENVDTATFSDYLKTLDEFGAGSMEVAPTTEDGKVLAVLIVAKGEEAERLSAEYDKWTEDNDDEDR